MFSLATVHKMVREMTRTIELAERKTEDTKARRVARALGVCLESQPLGSRNRFLGLGDQQEWPTL